MNFNLLKSTDYLMEQKASHSKIVCSAHIVFMFFCTYFKANTYVCPVKHKSIVIFKTKVISVYCTVRTGSLNKTVYVLY